MAKVTIADGAPLLSSFIFGACCVFSVAARADVITDWNEIAERVATAHNQQPFVQTRTFALLHVAMFEAVNAVEHRYQSYQSRVQVQPGTSTEAAAIAAAHGVLAPLFPASADELEVDLATALQAVPEGAAKEGGMSLGRQVAAAVIESRARDGFDAGERYQPRTNPGVYVSTVLPVASHWGRVQPWLINRGAQFRPGAPPKLGGREWAATFNEVKTVGAKNSTVRTKQETETALFWSVTGPLSWNPLVRQVAKAAGRSVSENARLFALIAMATADAHIAVFDAKYAYNFWRPVTAIRNGNNDHNALTVATPDWLPLLDTPLHPEYPCAHCITASTVATILQAEFRDKTPPTLSMTSPTAPGVTRTWNNFAEYADEVSRARIYAGVHYRFSTRAGQRMGRAIAGFALQKLSLL